MNIELTCPHCSHQQEFEVYPQLNVSNEPGLKNMVLNFELFKDECESCQHIIPVAYQSVYHDFDQKLIIVIDPTQTQTPQEVDEMLQKEFGELDGYTIRLVHNPDELKEKILLRDSHLDDRVIEIVKQYYVYNAMEKDPSLKLIAVLFNRGLTEHEIVFVTESQQKFKAELNMSIVDHLGKLYQNKINELTSLRCNVIDSNWATQVLQVSH